MKRTIAIATVVFVSSFNVNGQASSPDTAKKVVAAKEAIPVINDEDDNDMRFVFTKVEHEANFPGGLKAWTAYTEQKLSSFNPAKKGAPKGMYQVVVRFIVSKKGKISDIQAETNNGYSMEKEVIKILNESPDWEPAIQNGRPVNAYRRQPVTFIVE